MKKIVLAFDSFKGSVGSFEIAKADYTFAHS